MAKVVFTANIQRFVPCPEVEAAGARPAPMTPEFETAICRGICPPIFEPRGALATVATVLTLRRRGGGLLWSACRYQRSLKHASGRLGTR